MLDRGECGQNGCEARRGPIGSLGVRWGFAGGSLGVRWGLLCQPLPIPKVFGESYLGNKYVRTSYTYKPGYR